MKAMIFAAMGNLMQWKFRMPAIFKKALRSMTEKTVHDVCTKTVWKADDVHKTAAAVRQYKERLGFSEQWMSEYVYNIVLLALAAAANSHGTLAFSLSSSITFLRASGPGDTLYAEARERYIGRSTGCYQVDVTNQNGDLIATFESSVFRKDQKVPFTL